jgi:nucleotidyltransferase substrate binding protein (TIGR01987 family)
MQQGIIGFDNLLKAQLVFEQFRKNLSNDQYKAGSIQAFKICYELSWKVMKHVLAEQKIESTAPRDVFRKASLAKLIDNPDHWFSFIEKRHLTSYTYEPENVNTIVESFDLFSEELKKVIERLQQQASR